MRRISLRFLVPIGAALTLGVSTFVVVLPTLPYASTPPVTIDNVDLTPAAQTVTPGWQAQTDTTANMVGVSWQGKAPADFTVEKRDPRGHWHSLAPVGTGEDPGVDPGSRDAKSARRHAATNSTEPVWVGNDTTAVRVKLDQGTATNVDLKVIKTPKVSTSPRGARTRCPRGPTSSSETSGVQTKASASAIARVPTTTHRCSSQSCTTRSTATTTRRGRARRSCAASTRTTRSRWGTATSHTTSSSIGTARYSKVASGAPTGRCTARTRSDSTPTPPASRRSATTRGSVHPGS